MAYLGAVLFALQVGAGRAAGQPVPVEQHTEKAAQEEKTDDTTSLAASLGGTLNTGNTKSWQLTSGADLLVVRAPHAVTAMAQLAYGEADLPDDDSDDFEPTVGNIRARARYDFFLTRMDAVFGAGVFRHDEFAGLDARIQGQAGYLRYFLRADNHRFWGEIGYDLTYDDYDALLLDPATETYSEETTAVIHSARLFLGYDNRLTESVTYLGGLEGLVAVDEPKDWRLNMDNALRSKLGGNFQLELKLSLQFDNVPAEGAERLDTQTVISVIYNLI